MTYVGRFRKFNAMLENVNKDPRYVKLQGILHS